MTIGADVLTNHSWDATYRGSEKQKKTRCAENKDKNDQNKDAENQHKKTGTSF